MNEAAKHIAYLENKLRRNNRLPVSPESATVLNAAMITEQNERYAELLTKIKTNQWQK